VSHTRSRPTQTENSLAYHIPVSSVDYRKNSFFYRTVRDWNHLPDDAVHRLHFIINCMWDTPSVSLHGERESRPFNEEPDIHLYCNQHYSSAPGLFLCYALSSGRTSTAIGQKFSTCWSLTILRKKRK